MVFTPAFPVWKKRRFLHLVYLFRVEGFGASVGVEAVD